MSCASIAKTAYVYRFHSRWKIDVYHSTVCPLLFETAYYDETLEDSHTFQGVHALGGLLEMSDIRISVWLRVHQMFEIVFHVLW
jgi:hypothetical protein